MSENKIIAKFLDDFEAEQQRILQLDPRERAMQANYSRVMGVAYELREFLRKRVDVPAIHPLQADMTTVPVEQAAPVTVPDELRREIEKLTQWKYCMDGSASYFGEPAGLIKSVTYQLERLLSAKGGA